MAVEETTEVVVDDTQVSDVDDTTSEISDDTSLEDIEVNLEDISDGSEDESETESTEEVEEAETEESQDDVEDNNDTEAGEDTDPKPTKEQVAHEAFKRREAERQLKAERDTRQAQDLQRYLDEAEDDEYELAKRQNQVEKFNIQREKSELTRDKLQVGIDRAMADIDLFRTGDDVVKEALASSLDDFEAMHVTKDDKGNPLEVRADVYQYLLKKADSIRQLTGTGARQQAKQKDNQNSRTVTPPVRTPKPAKVDPDMEAFDEEAYR